MNINGISGNNPINTGLDLFGKKETERTKQAVAAFESQVFVNGQPMSSTDVSKNFMSVIGEGLSSVEDTLKADAQIAKDNLKALFNKMSVTQASAMDEDGYHINDMDSEEILTVVDRIKIMLATYCENYQVISGDISRDQIEEAVGDIGLTEKISKKLSGTYMPTTKDNIKDVEIADEMAAELPETLDENIQKYLMRNDLEPTVANVYKAKYAAASGNVIPMQDASWQQLLPQVDSIIKEAGLVVNKENEATAKKLVEWQVDLTPENLQKLSALEDVEYQYNQDQFIEDGVKALLNGKQAKDVLITGKQTDAWQQAKEAVDVLLRATPQDVEKATKMQETFTIGALSAAQSSIEGYFAMNITEEQSQKVLENNRVLNEARLVLSAYSGRVLIENGIDLFHEDLKNITELLHEAQNRYVIEDLSKENAGSVRAEDIDRASNTWDSIRGLAFMPSAAIGRVMVMQQTMSIAVLQSEGASLRNRYEQAGQAYDTMSTKVRSDMGDSIKKAVSESAEAILTELGMEATKENVRSVRILASNRMEMTEDNLYAVKNYDLQINEIIDNISPQTVLDLIREGKNPLEMSVSELRSYMFHSQEDVSAEIQKYSEYLYELDQNGAISEKEREQYIGVYKMFRMFEKDGGKAVGALVAQGADLTIGNLVTAINSRKHYGMDVTLDTNAGMAEVIGKTQYFTSLFANMSKKITPSVLRNTLTESEKDNLEEVTAEEILENAGETKESRNAREEFYEELFSQVQEAAFAEENVIRMLTDYEIPVTFHNILGADGLSRKANRVLRPFFEDSVEDNLKENAENLAEHLESAKEAKEAYEKLDESAMNRVRSMLDGENSETINLADLRIFTQSVRLMGKMAERQEYVIPFETAEGIAVVNLKFAHQENEQGKIRMNIDYPNGNSQYIECTAQEERLDIFFAENGTDMNEEALIMGLDTLGYSDVSVVRVRSNEIPYASGSRQSAVSNERLYRTSKAIIKNLMGNGIKETN